MLLAALSRRYTAALFISWTSLRTADCCIAAIQLKAEKGTHSKRCVTTRREAERSQMPETAKNITCRYCFQNLTSTEGLKSSLQHTGLTSHAACASLQEKEKQPKLRPLHQHHPRSYLGSATCYSGLATQVTTISYGKFYLLQLLI